MHDALPLTEITIVVVAALALGLLFNRFKQPAILGYVFAGVVLGRSFLPIESYSFVVHSLAEMGVLMLLFVLGMEMNLKSFKEVWHITLGSVACQILAAIGTTYITSFVFGWDFGFCVALGGIMALSSTAVAIKMLESTGESKGEVGRLAVGILIAQDLAFIPMILIIKGFGSESFSGGIILLKLLIAGGIIGFMILFFTKRERVHIPFLKDVSQNNDLLPLWNIMFCFGAAVISGLFGLSEAYGAFLAGIILGNSAERQKVIKSTLPIQSTLLMVFFLSVGLLLDLGYVFQNLGKVLLLLLLITVGKTILNICILHIFKQKWSTAFLSSLMLAQIGEFSFVLSDAAAEAGIFTLDDRRLVISLTVLSLIFSPIWMKMARNFQQVRRSSINTFWEAVEIAGIMLEPGSMGGKIKKTFKSAKVFMKRKLLRRK